MKQRRGFSLIELLVVIAIIGIAASISWKGAADSRRLVQLDNACQGVATLINTSKEYALTGKKTSNTVAPKAFGVGCSANSCSVLYGNTLSSPASPSDLGSVLSSEKYDLTGGVTVTTSPAVVGFQIPGGIRFGVGSLIVTNVNGTTRTVQIPERTAAYCQ